MWAIAQFSLLKMRESAFYMLMIVAAVICLFTNSADPVTEQVARGSLFSYAFSGSSGEPYFPLPPRKIYRYIDKKKSTA